MRYPMRVLLLSTACSVALAAQAQAAPGRIDLPAGELTTALFGDRLIALPPGVMIFQAELLTGADVAHLDNVVELASLHENCPSVLFERRQWSLEKR